MSAVCGRVHFYELLRCCPLMLLIDFFSVIMMCLGFSQIYFPIFDVLVYMLIMGIMPPGKYSHKDSESNQALLCWCTQFEFSGALRCGWRDGVSIVLFGIQEGFCDKCLFQCLLIG